MFIVHHPFILRSSPNAPLDQQRQQIHTFNRSSRSSPKALEDPFITVLQDQAQKPLKIRSSPLFKIKPQWPLKKRSSSRSSPNGSLKIRSNPPSRSSPRPLKNVHP
ncbi:hypothetical protein ACFX1T_042368 [Malus domestica]